MGTGRYLSNFEAGARVADRAAARWRPPSIFDAARLIEARCRLPRVLWRDGPLAVVQVGAETRLERLGMVVLYGDREACVAAAIGQLEAA